MGVYHRNVIPSVYQLLNFIPWGIGGSLYLSLSTNIVRLTSYPGWELLFGAVMLFSVALQATLFLLLRPTKHFRFHRVGFFNLAFFYAPIVIAIGATALVYGHDILLLALIFGTIATAAEYAFGKACELFISKKLWNYTYLSVDRGHFTPLSIPLFTLGGFYFLLVMRVVGI